MKKAPIGLSQKRQLLVADLPAHQLEVAQALNDSVDGAVTGRRGQRSLRPSLVRLEVDVLEGDPDHRQPGQA